MAMRLQVCEDVAARLGAPTVQSLTRRLTPAAPCLECGAPVGEGLAVVIGQQHGTKALVTAAHAECRDSAWIRCEEAGQVQVPVSGDVTTAIEMELGPRLPRWPTRIIQRKSNV